MKVWTLSAEVGNDRVDLVGIFASYEAANRRRNNYSEWDREIMSIEEVDVED